MATMSHTPAQRKQWHDGKAKKYESSVEAFQRMRRKQQFGGAATPATAKRGVFYKP